MFIDISEETFAGDSLFRFLVTISFIVENALSHSAVLTTKHATA
jgi:hypothetical protein